MDFNNNSYLIKITDECYEEMKQIYDYIANSLKANNPAVKLLKTVKIKIGKLIQTNFIHYIKINNKMYNKLELSSN